MQIDRKTDRLLPCRCGHRPDHFSIGYGRTPYYVNCVHCQKYVGGCGGWCAHIIDWWNYHGRFAKGSIHLNTQGAPKRAMRDANSATRRAMQAVANAA